MEQSAGLLMITMLINQAVRSRSKYRKKRGTNANGPNTPAIVTADFSKSGTRISSICSSDKKKKKKRVHLTWTCHNIPCHYLIPESRGTSLSKDVPGCFVLFFQAYLFSLPIPLSKTIFCSSSLYEYYELWSSFMQLNRQQDFSC